MDEHPTHFRFRDGRVFDVNPWGALFGNSYFWHELTHMYLPATWSPASSWL